MVESFLLQSIFILFIAAQGAVSSGVILTHIFDKSNNNPYIYSSKPHFDYMVPSITRRFFVHSVIKLLIQAV